MRTIFVNRLPRWVTIADRILALCGIIGSFILVAVLCYEWGAADQRATTPKCEPKIHRMVYPTEELARMLGARKRMEKVK